MPAKCYLARHHRRDTDSHPHMWPSRTGEGDPSSGTKIIHVGENESRRGEKEGMTFYDLLTKRENDRDKQLNPIFPNFELIAFLFHFHFVAYFLPLLQCLLISLSD